MATTLDQSGRRAGGHVWVQSRLFEVLGGWVATTPEPEVRLLLDRHSHHAAWRASQWWDRLPVLADVDRSSLCAAPSPVAESVVGHLVGLDGTAARLAAAYRVVLPRTWACYEGHRRRADPVADGSSLRTLGIVAADLVADWHEGEAVLQALLTDGAAVGAAAGAVHAIEEMLVGGS